MKLLLLLLAPAWAGQAPAARLPRAEAPARPAAAAPAARVDALAARAAAPALPPLAPGLSAEAVSAVRAAQAQVLFGDALAWLSRTESGAELAALQKRAPTEMRLLTAEDSEQKGFYGRYQGWQARPVVIANGPAVGLTEHTTRGAAAALLVPVIAHELVHHEDRIVHGEPGSREAEERAILRGALVLTEQLRRAPRALAAASNAYARLNLRLLSAWSKGPTALWNIVAATYAKLPSLHASPDAHVADLRRRLASRQARGADDEQSAAMERELSFWTDANALGKARQRHREFRRRAEAMRASGFVSAL